MKVDPLHAGCPHKLIHDYGNGQSLCNDCCNFFSINKHAKKERRDDFSLSVWYFKELCEFPQEDELKKHFKIGRKYRMFRDLFQSDFQYGKSNMIRMLEGRYIKCSVEKSLKEFNEIIKFIYENNYNKFESIRLIYFPEL